MGRIWKIIPLAALVGCTGTKAMLKPLTDATAEVQKAVLPEPPAKPVAYCQCVWANRLQQLPDPVHGGRVNAGVVGQAFIWDAESLPTDAAGELTIRVTDATTTANHTPHTTEVWNFSSTTLRLMRVNDDRWGRSHALFLPWPDDWGDVNRLSIQSRYDQPGHPTVYSQETVLTLDMTNGPGATAGGVVPGGSSSQSMVPDPAAARRNATVNPPPAVVPVQHTEPAAPAKPFERTIIKRQ